MGWSSGLTALAVDDLQSIFQFESGKKPKKAFRQLEKIIEKKFPDPFLDDEGWLEDFGVLLDKLKSGKKQKKTLHQGYKLLDKWLEDSSSDERQRIAQLQKLLQEVETKKKPEKVFCEIDELLEEWVDPVEHQCDGAVDIDKSWEVLHLCFSNSEFLHPGPDAPPHNKILLGGDREWLSDGRIAAIKLPGLVKDIHKTIGKISKQEFKKRLMTLKKTDLGDSIDEDPVEYYYRYFGSAQVLYEYAARESLAVVFSASC